MANRHSMLNLFTRKDSLKGSEIASFRLHQTRWQIAAKIIGIACLLLSLVQQAYPILPRKLLADPVFLLGLAVSFLFDNRRIQFYEKGLRIPKAAGFVFLSREQLKGIRLDGSCFIVIGSDATWGGPYSGGRFRVSSKDLARFRDVLGQFTTTADRMSSVQ